MDFRKTGEVFHYAFGFLLSSADLGFHLEALLRSVRARP